MPCYTVLFLYAIPCFMDKGYEDVLCNLLLVTTVL
uniref:Uncharacterized protein n=1 Tax=Anguilla anguilla TaxID=7936 RepID=A0A0E9QAJ4_ANGAN